MATTSDVRDILELESNQQNDFVTKESLMNDGKKVGLLAITVVWLILLN